MLALLVLFLAWSCGERDPGYDCPAAAGYSNAEGERVEHCTAADGSTYNVDGGGYGEYPAPVVDEERP